MAKRDRRVVAANDAVVQGRSLVTVDDVDICALVDEELRDLDVTVGCRNLQRIQPGNLKHRSPQGQKMPCCRTLARRNIHCLQNVEPCSITSRDVGPCKTEHRGLVRRDTEGEKLRCEKMQNPCKTEHPIFIKCRVLQDKKPGHRAL